LQADPEKTNTVEFMSLSKTYNMPGWRLGACVGNRDAIAALLTVKSNIDSGHFRPVYDAGAAALNDTPQHWMDERNARYQARRERILETCPAIGLEAMKTPGSLYVWARVLDGDDQVYARSALDKTYVSIAPGQMFGEAGRGFLRFSIAVEDSALADALSRLRTWYQGR
jgi:LL-diaminopimelate aminotransferase